MVIGEYRIHCIASNLYTVRHLATGAKKHFNSKLAAIEYIKEQAAR